MKRAFERLPEERRELILDNAIEVFAERGYGGAGVAEICARAGISNGAMYKYFENKDDLFRAVAERGSRIVEGVYDRVDAGLPYREYFRALLELVRSESEARRSAISLYIEMGNPALNRFAEGFSSRIEPAGIGRVREYLESARARGELAKALDLPAAVFAIDNLIVLYGFSLVSEYHERRLASFMGGADKIEFILRTVDIILS